MAKSPEHKMTDREIAVGQTIRGVCANISDALTDGANATEAKNAASNDANTGRLGVILRIAEISATENWTETEVRWGCEYAAKIEANDKRIAKTLATFCSEMKSVASPKVRDDVKDIHAACVAAWEAETDAIAEDKAAPRPLRAFAKRQYHLILSAIKEQRLGQVYIQTPADVVAWAEANDPSLSADKAAEEIAKIVENLQSIYVFFDHGELQACANALATIDAKTLRGFATKPDLRSELPKPPATMPAVAPVAAVQPVKPVLAVAPPPSPLAPVQPAPAPAHAPTHAHTSEPHEGAAGLAAFMNDPDDEDENEDADAELLAAD